MTIRFHCPYCAAPIEVADSAGGKSGRCPICAASLTVPGGAPTRPPSAAAIPTPPGPAAESAPVVAEIEMPAVSVADVVTPQLGVLPDPTRPRAAAGPNSVARKLQRKTRRRRRLGVPVLFGLVFAGVLTWLVVSQMDWSQGGPLKARLLTEVELPPMLLGCEQAPLSGGQLEDALQRLNREPILLAGEVIQSQIRGQKRELVLTVRPGRKTVWYEIDTRSQRRIFGQLQKHRVDWEAVRTADVTKARNDFLESLVKVQMGDEPSFTLTPYRDRLVLPASVRALGYHVVAKAGRELFPCVREPEEGLLYFLMPEGVTSVELIGRTLPNGTTPFSGQYAVTLVKPQKSSASPQPVESIDVEMQPEPAPAGESSPGGEMAAPTAGTMMEPEP